MEVVEKENSNLEKYMKQGTEHNVLMRLDLIKEYALAEFNSKLIFFESPPTPSIAQPNNILWQKSLCCEVKCRWKQKMRRVAIWSLFLKMTHLTLYDFVFSV